MEQDDILLSTKQVARMFEVSCSSVIRLMKLGVLPKPIKWSVRTWVWSLKSLVVCIEKIVDNQSKDA